MSNMILSKELDPAIKMMLKSNNDVGQNVFKFISETPLQIKTKIQSTKTELENFLIFDGVYNWQLSFFENEKVFKIEKYMPDKFAKITYLSLAILEKETVKNLVTKDPFYVGEYARPLSYDIVYDNDVSIGAKVLFEVFECNLLKKETLLGTKFNVEIRKDNHIETYIKNLHKKQKINIEKTWSDKEFNFQHKIEKYKNLED